MEALTPEERLLLFHCRDHDVAFCRVCARWYQFTALGADFFGSRSAPQLCPECRSDLIVSLRLHLLACPEALRRITQRTREAITQSLELGDASEVRIIESETRLRRAMRDPEGRRGGGGGEERRGP